jgi:JmjC domain, hydroxylase
MSVQDYPPKGDLEKVHPELHNLFMHCVAKMSQTHISPHGPLNLFSYFPEGSLIPDLGRYRFAILGCAAEFVFPFLGPKLYVSEVCSTYIQAVLGLIVEQADLEASGTTKVHMDKAGAINIMFYSKPGRDGRVLGARWDIWPSSSIFSLSKALDPSASNAHCVQGQAIVSETQYISPDVGRAAFLKSGVRGWHTIQLPGEAVVIPPGCPHQVSLLYTL